MNKAIILLVCLLAINTVSAKGFKLIPKPIITTINKTETSPNSIVELRGQGFIKNMPSAHQVILVSSKEKIKVNVIQSNGDLLRILIPEYINFGDYDIYVKIKTKLLRSKKSKINEKLKLRPIAPTKPQLKYLTIKHQSEFEEILDKEANLYYQTTNDLKIGENQIQSYYYQNGFQSILSDTSPFFYLPEIAVENQLEIKSESPIQSFAIARFLETKYDVSLATSQEQNELSRHYYLKTPSQERYLEYSIELSPVFIDKLHVAEPEYVILQNRSSNDFDLLDCSLSDSIRERYRFDKQNIKAKSELKLEANLGLNDTSPDYLELKCAEKIVDNFSYESIDTGGFGKRL